MYQSRRRSFPSLNSVATSFLPCLQNKQCCDLFVIHFFWQILWHLVLMCLIWSCPVHILTTFIIGGVVLLWFICYSMLSVKMRPGANTILLNNQDTVSSVLLGIFEKVSEQKLHFIVNPEWCWWVLQCALRF